MELLWTAQDTRMGHLAIVPGIRALSGQTSIPCTAPDLPETSPGLGSDGVGPGDSSEPFLTKACWEFQTCFSPDTNSEGWQLQGHFCDPPRSAQQQGIEASWLSYAESRKIVHSVPPSRSHETPHTGRANKVKEPVDEEMPGTARDASTL